MFIKCISGQFGELEQSDVAPATEPLLFGRGIKQTFVEIRIKEKEHRIDKQGSWVLILFLPLPNNKGP